MDRTSATPGRAGLAALAIAAVLLAGAIGWSLRGWHAGAPAPVASMTDDPFATLRARAEATPGDADAWLALGDAEGQAGRFDAAAASFTRATEVAPKRADAWSALGEALAKASARDPLPPAAYDAFRRAAAIDPRDARARYYLAVHRDLSGDHKGAVDDWFALLRDTPPGAPWETDLRRTIEQVGRINRIEVSKRLAANPVGTPSPAPAPLTATAAIPGPDADQLRAASALSPSQQQAMAEGMVARLEARLQADPANLDGWAMLMRSRMTLGQTAKAAAARDAAIAANPAAAARLRAEAAALGVP